MDNLECPNCHQKSIPLWRKMFLGPATSVTCASCGSRVSVPLAAMLTAVPFLAALVAAQFIVSFAVSAVVVAAGIAVMVWLHYKYVPLVVKERREVKP